MTKEKIQIDEQENEIIGSLAYSLRIRRWLAAAAAAAATQAFRWSGVSERNFPRLIELC